jgi:hypothetical protein
MNPRFTVTWESIGGAQSAKLTLASGTTASQFGFLSTFARLEFNDLSESHAGLIRLAYFRDTS